MADAIETATLLIIAVGLAMDCFAVSVSRGICTRSNRLGNAIVLSASFGGFQAAMTLAGWKIGESLIGWVSMIDHWVAFALLSFVGLKMIYESRKEESEREIPPLGISLLVLLSIATSIDALAVGLSIAFLKMSVLSASLLIGAVSSALSFTGFFLGCKAGKRCGSRAEAAGGIILICIGLKIILEHLTG